MAMSKYTMVSKAKMKAWMTPMNRSKSFQTTSRQTRTLPMGIGRASRPQGGDQRQHQVPEKRLPKSRRARVIGLAISSTTLMKMLNGSRNSGNGWVQ